MTRWESLWTPGGRSTLAPRLLWPVTLPLEALFRGGVSLRRAAYRRRWLRTDHGPLPVISVGGIEVGGVGKTPLTREMLRLARESGLRPAVVLRGYGARRPKSSPSVRPPALRVPVPVPRDASLHFGDEAALLAEAAHDLDAAGVFVAAERILGVQAAREAGADCVFLDDGFQHWRLAREAEIVCLSGAAPFGNGHLLPAGPLREDPREALPRADCVILSAVAEEQAAAARAMVEPLLRPDVPVLSWMSRPGLHGVGGEPPGRGDAVRLLAGIAHPERLRPAVESLGLRVVEVRFFRDHHWYEPGDLEGWLGGGTTAGRSPAIVTTEKDWMRLRVWIPADVRVALLTQTVCWNEPEAEERLRHWIQRKVGRSD